MSIRPVDYTSLVLKSQELSKIKQAENQKIKAHINQSIIRQNKQIKKDIKRVRDSNKSENLIIDTNKKKKENKENQKKRQRNEKKKIQIENKIGTKIDIKI